MSSGSKGGSVAEETDSGFAGGGVVSVKIPTPYPMAIPATAKLTKNTWRRGFKRSWGRRPGSPGLLLPALRVRDLMAITVRLPHHPLSPGQCLDLKIGESLLSCWCKFHMLHCGVEMKLAANANVTVG